MKLIIKTTKLKNLLPGDIRRYIGDIVDVEYKDKVLWHKRDLPELFYAKPYKDGFEIVSYKNNLKLLNHIKDKLLEYPKIDLKDIKATIKDVFIKEEDYPIPQKQLSFYVIRTPVILAVNNTEFKLVYTIDKNNNEKDFLKFLHRRFKSDLSYKLKKIYNVNMEFDDLELMFDEKVLRLVEVKEGAKKFPALFGKFACNYKLPRFISYKNGLGFGEIIEIKPYGVR